MTANPLTFPGEGGCAYLCNGTFSFARYVYICAHEFVLEISSPHTIDFPISVVI